MECLKALNQDDIPNTETADRISALPIILRSHILSFLPTRCAVATSILSTRWKYVWINIPVLDFNDLPSSMTNMDTALVSSRSIVFNQAQYATFRNFVDKVLLLNGAPCLKRVQFETYDGFSARHVFEWMLVIIRRCVQELCFIIKNFVLILPSWASSSLLAQEKLVVLKLQGFRLHLPSSFQLPCLQSFSLIDAVLCDSLTDDPWTLFLANCPVLEELNIEHCDGLEKLSVCSSSIKILRVVLANDPQRAILIETPNLEVLHLSLGIIQSKVNDLSSLVEARLDICTSSIRWVKLLQRISYAKTLALHDIMLNGSTAFMRLPIFQNLTHMEVGFTAWSVVLQIISNAPKLVSFVIHKMMFDWPDDKPRAKELSLERIKYYGSDNVDECLEVVEYFLSNSALLKEFKVYTCSWLESTIEIKFLQKLLNLPRVSKHCKIIALNEVYDLTSGDSDSESEGSISDASTSVEDEEVASVKYDGRFLALDFTKE